MNIVTRRRFYLIYFIAILLLACKGREGVQKPNIILIVADDLGFSDLGCYGGEISTPNLDRLASYGIRFKQFYNSGVCLATRAEMLTGVYTRSEGDGYLKDNMVTIAEVLKNNGYSTILSGKWHLGDGASSPNNKGFEEYYGSIAGAINYFDPTLPTDPPFVKHLHSAKQPFRHNKEILKSVSINYYSTDAITDHAIGEIKSNVDKKQPFFLHLAYNAPHYPLQALSEDIKRYKGIYKDGYSALRKKRFKKLNELGLVDKSWGLPDTDTSMNEVRYDLPVIPWNEVVNKEYESSKMEVYAAMVDRMDQNIGRVLNTLKETGIEENTIVIFFSDNGGCASLPKLEMMNTYYQYNEGKDIGSKNSYEFCGPGWATAQSSPFRRYKAWTYEGGISTPMIASWKGKIKPNVITNEVGHVVDILPTVLDIADAIYPDEFKGKKILPLEGVSLLPTLILGSSHKHDLRPLGWYLYGNRAFRKGDWKVVWGVSSKKWELYNMEDDRTEENDLSEKHPEVVDELSTLWWKWAKKCNYQKGEIENW